MEIWQFFFAKVVYEHKLGAVGSTYVRLLGIYLGVTLPKIIEVDWHSTKLLQKQNVCTFWVTEFL